ncbi:MAG TPA: hypothetical protein PK299_14105 [Anaerolineales bacterium]|nr:hypothetical protein [Anaerolineales bacterium]
MNHLLIIAGTNSLLDEPMPNVNTFHTVAVFSKSGKRVKSRLDKRATVISLAIPV